LGHTQPVTASSVRSVTFPDRSVTIPFSPVTMPDRSVTLVRNTQQSDREPERTAVGHRVGERRIDGRLTAAEHHRVEQPDAAAQPVEQVGPGRPVSAGARLQMGIVAIAATPRAALHEDDRAELAGIVDAGEGCQAADAQRRARPCRR
jgi:hypothetical protein